jgi:hypothetical protein
VDEGRKRVLLIAAAIIASRRLAQLDFKLCPAYASAIAEAITAAEHILRRIDSKWPKKDPDRDF